MSQTEPGAKTIDVLSVLSRNYLASMPSAPLVAPEKGRALADQIKNRIRLIQVRRVVYSKKREKIEELLNVLSALDGQGCSIVMLIEGHKSDLSLTLGVVSQTDDMVEAATAEKVLRSALLGNFPGSEIARVSNDVAHRTLEAVTGPQVTAVASVIGIPASKTEASRDFVQGLDRYLDAMRGTEFAIVVIAEHVEPWRLEQSYRAYCDLHTITSALAEVQLTRQVSEAVQVTEGEQHSVSEAFAQTVGMTQTTTTTTSTSRTRPSGVGYILSAIGGGIGAWVGGPVGMAVGMGLGLQLGGQKTTSTSDSSSSSRQESETRTTTTTSGTSRSVGKTEGREEGTSFTIRDRHLRRVQDVLDRHITRLDHGRRYGFWNTGIYFLGETPEIAIAGTSVLRGLFSGEMSELEPPRTLLWDRGTDPARFEALLTSLRSLEHPRARASGLIASEAAEGGGLEYVHPTTLMSSRELALVMGLPEKSAPGIAVIQTEPFAQEVLRQGPPSTGPQIAVGRIHHLGSDGGVCSIAVADLAGHTLVTGTTGSGKTNATLSLIESLDRLDEPVAVLVIEPVKQEYRVLGALGTASRPWRSYQAGSIASDLLRLNPFEFPAGTHVFEHVERLVQVFNAAFPMYAAMPALLEEGIRRSYEARGWDLAASRCHADRFRFPTFVDLEEQLECAIQEAGYSERAEADYRGALLTRIRSLSRGIRGAMLCPLPGECTPVEHIFDEPCVVNLSSLGSPETRSLVMALILMRLYEHRQVQMTDPEYRDEVTRRRLRHVTVIEEAHHLLKRCSTDQSDETANLRGMAVEMFVNAIAEMRAFGEGFLVVDQSASSLDLSVIKNTNTKIVFRTPFLGDRELVGDSVNATPEQIIEIGRLATGMGVVYQNDWHSPILCRFGRHGIDIAADRTPDPSTPALGREQILRLFALPATAPGTAVTEATRLLDGSGLSLDEAVGLVESVFAVPGIKKGLTVAYAGDTASGFDLLRQLLVPLDYEGDNRALVLSAVVRLLGLRPSLLKRLLTAMRSASVGIEDPSKEATDG